MKQITDETPMAFGKFKDLQMGDIPAKYLLWLGEQMAKEKNLPEWKKKIFDYIEENIDVLRKEAEQER